MSKPAPELLILSGGSEIVGLALAGAAYAAGVPYAVFSLVRHSILKDAPGCVAWTDLLPQSKGWDGLRDRFLLALSRLPREPARGLALLPTEDGSLRLLNECRDDVLAFGEFARARALRMGGIDKAEVVELAARKGVSAELAPARVLNDPDDASAALDAFGVDAVFKPALKPMDMDLSGMGSRGVKVITRVADTENPDSVVRRLRDAWPLSSRWIAQPRLRTGAGLERSVCAVRGDDTRACQVVERAKHPRMGGTAYWVSIDRRSDLIPSATSVLEALDVVGICELSYLSDAAGNGKLIELNPRPWLQIGLAERAGFAMVTETIAALRGDSSFLTPLHINTCDWLQPERALLALLARQCSLREWTGAMSTAFRRSTVVGGWGSEFPTVRRRLAMRALRKIVRS